jgi:hypothetical protein
MAQARVKFVPGLGGAAGVHIFYDMRATFQHHNHLSFELGWQNRFHKFRLPANGRIIWQLRY